MGKQRIDFSQERAITVYNAEKKEPVGIFANVTLAARYVFQHFNCDSSSRIANALSTTTRMRKKTTGFECDIAIRYANEKQLATLDENEFVIYDGYPQRHSKRMNGFSSTKETFYADAVDRTLAYGQEVVRINKNNKIIG